MVLRVVSLFTGIGGLDFGFEAAGFETAVASELDRTACRTVRLNRPWPLLEGDIHNVSSQAIMEAGGLHPGETDVLIGGPPCQPFSKSSYWRNGDSMRLDDPRSSTLAAYLRVLRDLRPRSFLLENVQGLTYKGKDEGLRYLLDGISEVNKAAGTSYSIQWRTMRVAEHGVPQLRERVFIIGARDGHPFRFPEPTHGDPGVEAGLLGALREPYRNAWDAIGDLPKPNDEGLRMTGAWADLLPSIPEGQNYLWHTNRGGGLPLFGWRTRYWSFLLKLSKHLPSWTIQAQPGSAIGPFHWNNRRLTFEEMCRLQTFPDGLRVECGRTEVQRMLGNAVPSLMAEILAREIRTQLLGAPVRGPIRLLPPRRGGLPPPEPVADVPGKYRHLMGKHPDHPGEGKGRMAIKRLAVAA